jgi:hypothetical protein
LQHPAIAAVDELSAFVCTAIAAVVELSGLQRQQLQSQPLMSFQHSLQQHPVAGSSIRLQHSCPAFIAVCTAVTCR